MCEAGKRPARSSPIPRPLPVSVIVLGANCQSASTGTSLLVCVNRVIPRTQEMIAQRRETFQTLLRQQSQGRAIITIARSCSQTSIHTQVLRGRAGARPTARKKSRTGVHELLATGHQQTCLFSASIHLLVQPFLTSRNGIRN